MRQCFVGVSISTAATRAVTEDSSVGDNFEDLTNSDLEIESLKRKPYSAIEEIVVRTSHVNDKSDTCAECLSNSWSVYCETTKRMLGVASKRCARMDNPSLARIHSTND